MQTGQHGDVRGIGVGGLRRDVEHQFVDAGGERFHFDGVAGRTQGVGTAQDGDADRLFDGGFHGGVPRKSGAQLVDLPEELFDPRTDLFALGMQQPVVLGEAGDFGLGFGRLFESGLFFGAQMRHHLDGALNAVSRLLRASASCSMGVITVSET